MPGPSGATRPAAVRLARFSAGVIALAALGEGLLRLLYHPSPEAVLTAQLRAKLLAADATLGWHLRSGADETVGGIRYQVTGRGTRGTESVSRDPSAVVIVGDADTMGWGVVDDAAFPAQIERLYATRRRARAIINGGVLGYGVQQDVVHLEDLVSSSDAGTALLAYTPESVESPETAFVERWPRWSLLLQLVFSSSEGVRPSAETLKARYDSVSTSWHNVPTAFAKLAGFCREKHVACGVVLLPKLDGHPYPLASVHQAAALAAAKNGLPALDLASVIAEVDPHTYWVSPSDEHPNAKLHARYAEEMFRWMEAWQPIAAVR